MNSFKLAKLVEYGVANGLDSLLVVRHGKIVAEAYYAPFKPGMRHTINSSTKAIVGTLTAIALKQGILTDVNQSIEGLLPAMKSDDAMRKEITIRMLLDMTSGIEWTEPLDGYPKSYLQMKKSSDWVTFIAGRPMAGEPGQRFNYNSGGSHLLSAILSAKTGSTTFDYAKGELFGPLGITDVEWKQDPQGVYWGGAGLYLQPRDMAKIGYLYLNDGVWEGKRLFDADWIEKIRHAEVDMRLGGSSDFHYANQFWTFPSRHAYMAVGANSQIILVLPNSDIVTVLTGRGNSWLAHIIDMLQTSVEAEQALPPNANAQAELSSAVAHAAQEKPVVGQHVSTLAKAISGKTYHLVANEAGIESITLRVTGRKPTYDVLLREGLISETPRHLSGPLGLDGFFKLENVDDLGQFGAKGAWIESNTLSLMFRAVTQGEATAMTLSFDKDGVHGVVDTPHGFTLDLVGAVDIHSLSALAALRDEQLVKAKLPVSLPPEGRIGLFSSKGGTPVLESPFGIGWSTTTDATFNGKSTVHIAVKRRGLGGHPSLAMNGNLDPAFGTPFAGIRFTPGQTARLPANLTSASGLRFFARGTSGSYNFGAGSEGRFASQEFKLDQTWKEITIRFADLKDFDPAKTDFLEIAAGYRTGPYQFELADVRLFKD